MKSGKLAVAIAAIALGVCLQPTIGWCTRAYSPVVTGVVTATSSGTIEIDHHSYHVKANSAAAKAMISIYVGETVEVLMDGPPNGAVEVISITPHAGS
jgi:hypothetical protein